MTDERTIRIDKITHLIEFDDPDPEGKIPPDERARIEAAAIAEADRIWREIAYGL